MGTGHVMVMPCFLKKLQDYPDVTILSINDLGDGFYNLLVESKRLPEGYNGQTEAFFREDGILHFRRETDT